MQTSPPVLQRVDLDSPSAVGQYIKATTSACPFIEPSVKSSNLFWCEITPDCRSAAEIHPRLFEQLVPLVERFRLARAALVAKPDRLLISHTVVIRMMPELDDETIRQLSWPNWLGVLLKQLYTPKEVVFGFVRKDVQEKSFFGGRVPVAPFHAVVIRSRVVGSDARFFTGNKPMLQAMMEAEDDGKDVHAAIFGQTPDIGNPQAMREAGYYDRVRQWCQSVLPRR